MDIILICRQAEENSVLTNVVLALEAVQRGQTAAVLFTEDALAALAGRSFRWAPLLSGRDDRIQIARQATKLGLPFAAERDNRWTDVPRLLRAAGAAGVALWACPLWSRLLGLAEPVPASAAASGQDSGTRSNGHASTMGGMLRDVVILEDGRALAELRTAATVIGGF
jgi:hypothetical protein